MLETKLVWVRGTEHRCPGDVSNQDKRVSVATWWMWRVLTRVTRGKLRPGGRAQSSGLGWRHKMGPNLLLSEQWLTDGQGSGQWMLKWCGDIPQIIIRKMTGRGIISELFMTYFVKYFEDGFMLTLWLRVTEARVLRSGWPTLIKLYTKLPKLDCTELAADRQIQGSALG